MRISIYKVKYLLTKLATFTYNSHDYMLQYFYNFNYNFISNIHLVSQNKKNQSEFQRIL